MKREKEEVGGREEHILWIMGVEEYMGIDTICNVGGGGGVDDHCTRKILLKYHKIHTL